MDIGPEIERLFHEVADLAPVARDRYFEEHGVLAEIRCEVESLLDHDTSPEDDFSRIVGNSAARLLDPDQAETEQRCGPYALVRMLGRGGMGAVYLAERVDGEVEQRVAIKFLRYGGDEPAFLDRFHRERQILATLSHPGIARLLDAGHTSDGRPYLAMDYIDGAPIDIYAAKLDLRTTLELFIQVCEAVSYAHQNLIIHRDIKPSNILVDSAGQPKLLDFGIAKLLEPEEPSAAATMLTRQWGEMLTPEYAAPEQVSGGPITTAIDVYALGVLLFLLLTGQHPLGSAHRSHADLLKAITDTEAPRPSDITARTSPAFGRQFRGDLDTVVAKALKKDPRERYASVAALSDDVRRYLRNEPISARPDTLAYRTAKFVRRNRTVVVLGAAALLALIAGVTGTLMQARRARVQRDFAVQLLSRAEAVNDLNSFVLSDAAPSGKPFTVDGLLQRAERIVERQTADQTRRADLLVEIGRQYTVNDEYGKARQLLEQAYRLSRTVPDAAIRANASCALAQTLSRFGESTRAERLYREGLDSLPNQPLYVLDRIFCQERGSEVAENRGAAAEAVKRALAAQNLLKQLPVRSELTEVNALITLAGAYSNAGRHQEASAAFGRAAGLLTALGRDRTQRAGTVFNNWGVVLILAGRPLEAEKVFRRVIEISRTDNTDETVQPMPLVNYARVLRELGRLDEARRYADQGYGKAQQTVDETALDQSLLLRAAIYRDQHDLERSAQMLAEVEPRLRRTLPAGHIGFATFASERALNAEVAGNLPLALSFSNQAVDLVETLAKAGRQGSDRLPLVLTRRSEVELRLGRAPEAAADASRAVSVVRATAEPGTFSTTAGRAYFALGRALLAQQKNKEARAAFESAAEHLQGALGRDHPETRAARQLATNVP
ncbi:MAG TPA: protein kinase [Bryobacteraceae bacterium]|jgi:tetratricopeptide (TPR) repeat protein|nr:protein kinase [Bryobacteraceae bacterium]